MATSSPIPARRGSLVGPLIVLLLGVILLIGNLRPDLSVWRMFARYWPFLLIFWGVARLLEYAIARLSSRPAPRTLTAGEVFLVVLICLAGNAFSAADRGDWGSWRWSSRGLEVFGESYDFTVQTSKPVPPNASLVIENPQGNVRVVGSDTPEVRITGRKTIKAFDRADAERADKDTPVEITEEGGRIHVRTNQDRVPGSRITFHGTRRISSDLEISVPKAANLRLEGRLGDFDVQNVVGPVEVTSGNAGVRLSNIEKNVRVNLRRSDVVRAVQVKGNVEISGKGRDIEIENVAGAVTIDGDFSGTIKLHNLAKPARYNSSMTDLSFEKLPGRLEMDLGSLHATDIVGPTKLTTRSKDIHIEGFSRDIEISTRRGDVELREPNLPLANVQVQSQNGNVVMALPGGANFSLEARTTRGKVENEYGDVIQVEDVGRSAKSRGATASRPGAGAQIRLNTERGDITLKKATHLQSL